MATTDLARLVVRLEANISQYTGQLDQAQKTLVRFEKSATGAARRAGAAFSLLARAGGIAFLASKVVELSDTYTTMQNRLALVTDGSAELLAVQNRLFDSANRTRTSFESVVDLYGRLARSTDQMGLSQERLANITEGVNQAVRISGSTVKESIAGVIQFGQALASDRLAGDELRSLLENMPRLARALADGLGVSIGKLREMGAAGELNSKKVIAALESQLPRLKQEFGQIKMTVGESLVVLGNQILQMMGKFQQTGAIQGLIKAILLLAHNLENLVVTLLSVGAAFTVFNVAVATSVWWAGDFGKKWLQVFAAVATGRATLLGSAAAEKMRAAAMVQSATAASTAATAEIAKATATQAATAATARAAVVGATDLQIKAAQAIYAVRVAKAEAAVALAKANSAMANIRDAQTSAAAATANQALAVANANVATAVAAATVAKRASSAASAQIAATNTAAAAATEALTLATAQAGVAQAGLAVATARAGIAVRATSGAWGMLRNAIYALIPGLATVTALLLANPWTAAIAAIVGAGVALAYFSDKINTANGEFISLRSTAIATFELIAEKIKPLTDLIGTFWQGIKDIATVVFDFLGDAMDVFAEQIKRSFWLGPIIAFFNYISEKMGILWTEIQDRARVIEGGYDRTKGPSGRYSRAGKKPPKPAAVEPDKEYLAARDKIQDAIDKLKEQFHTYQATAEGAIRYRIALGDLAEAFNKLGAAEAAAKRDELVEYTNKIANQMMDKEMLGIEQQIAELRGDPAAAAAMAFENQMLETRLQLLGLGRTLDIEKLDTLRELVKTQAVMNQLEQKRAIIMEDLAATEERWRLAVEIGASTEYNAAINITRARQLAVVQLTAVIEAMKAAAAEADSPVFNEAVKRATHELDLLAKQVDVVGQSIQKAFEETMSNSIASFLDGTATAQEAFRGFINDITKQISDFVAKDLVRRMFGDLFTGGGATPGGGGIIEKIGGFMAGIFGGKRDSGGRGSPGKAYMIGTGAQPELFVPDAAGSFTPRGDMGQTVNQSITVNAPSGGITRQTEMQIAAAARRGIETANARNN